MKMLNFKRNIFLLIVFNSIALFGYSQNQDSIHTAQIVTSIEKKRSKTEAVYIP